MSFANQPRTQAGSRFLRAADQALPLLTQRADEADRSASVCRENFDDLRELGITSAFVPEELGGFGVTSIHDWILGLARLAQGDGSPAIAVNMHLSVCASMARAFQRAKANGWDTAAAAAPLHAIASGDMLICATATERDTDNLHPFTEAKAKEDGWLINGTKMFATLSPLATHVAMNLRVVDDAGAYIATTLLPMGTPGIEPADDWDALGMRASGSQSIRFKDVHVEPDSVHRLGPWGEWSIPVLMSRTLANLPLVAAFLGMAEAAYQMTVEAVNAQVKRDRPQNQKPGVQQMVGEMAIELAQCQSILAHAGDNLDRFLEAHADATPTLAEAHEIMRDYQCAKWVVNRGAIEIVSRAMDLVGGGGFMNAHPLTRLYRDVRAGPFMQPYAPPEAREYVGKVSLGLMPDE